MKNETKTKFIEWIKAHKKELVIAGISITAIVALILGHKNRKQLMDLWATLQKALSKAPDMAPVGTDIAEKVAEKAAPVVEIIEPAKLVVVDASSIDLIPFAVSKHIRNLPDGCHPSAEKMATAAETGIKLLPNQTWVAGYMKGGVAA